MSALTASWLTPSSLFLLLNVMIGTIFLISRLSPPKRPHDHQQFGHGDYNSAPPLQRAPSLLDRVKSINFSTYKFPLSNYQDIDHHLESDNLAGHRLERTPSFLERVKSTNFSLYKFSPQNPETCYIQPTEHKYTNPQPLSREPSFLERVKSIDITSFYRSDSFKANPEKEPPATEEPDSDTDMPPLSRTPSFLERVKSIDFTSFYRSDSFKANTEKEPPGTEELDSDTDMSPVHGHVKRSRSESEVKQRKLPEKVKKSASENSRRKAEEREKEETEEEVERRRPATTRIEKTVSFGDGDQGVDAKADDFINKFKQQLKLQRLDSLLRSRGML